VAEDGAALVEVVLAPQPAVVDSKEALKEGAPLLHPELGSNCIVDRSYLYGDVDGAFANADLLLEEEFRYPRNSCTPMETGGVVAEFCAHDGSYDLRSNFMGPFSLHVVAAAALKVPGNRLRHRSPRDSGGSFGVKQAMLPYLVMAALASRKAGGPVKFIEDRLEHLTALTSATARSTRLKAAIRRDGKILALDFDQIEDCGAFLRAPEPATLYRMHGCMTGAYAIESLRIRNRVVMINKTPTGLVRGFGGPQVYFALEGLVRRIAERIGKTVPEVMAVNFIQPTSFPYRAAAGALYDSGNYPAALAALLTHPIYQRMREKKQRYTEEGRLYGIGYAAIVEPSISNMGYITTVLTADQRAKAGPKNGALATATVSIDPSGAVTVILASAPAGQGHQTVTAEVVARVFGIPAHAVVVNTELDTQKDAWSAGSGNYSSRFAGAVAGCAQIAAIRLKAKLSVYAAELWHCKPDEIAFENGQVKSTKDPGQSMGFGRLAGTFHWSPALTQEALGTEQGLGLRETAFFSPETLSAPDAQDRVNTSAAYGFVLDVCGVEIDTDTCQVRVDEYLTIHDAGTILNPSLADGQIYGAFAQGIGAALYEEFLYDAEGNFQSGTFADYRLPTAMEVPRPTIVHQCTPSPFTPLGAKGLGEGNNMSTPICIANAVGDALKRSEITLPASPPRIHRWLCEAGAIPQITPDQQGDAVSNPSTEGPLKASGRFVFPVSPEALFAVLLDENRIERIIPGCESIRVRRSEGAVHYDCTAVIRIGLVKARFDASMGLTDIIEPESLRLSGAGQSSLGFARGAGLVRLIRQGSQTALHYEYQASVSGKLAAIGSRLLEGATRLVLAELFRSLAREALRGVDGGKLTTAHASWWHRLLYALGLRR
jgi:2-furoyl-CoA dehydrogenase large subunit